MSVTKDDGQFGCGKVSCGYKREFRWAILQACCPKAFFRTVHNRLKFVPLFPGQFKRLEPRRQVLGQPVAGARYHHVRRVNSKLRGQMAQVRGFSAQMKDILYNGIVHHSNPICRDPENSLQVAGRVGGNSDALRRSRHRRAISPPDQRSLWLRVDREQEWNQVMDRDHDRAG